MKLLMMKTMMAIMATMMQMTMAITILSHHFHYHHGLYEYDYGKYHFPETCVGETLDDEDDDGDYGNDDVVDNGDHNPH